MREFRQIAAAIVEEDPCLTPCIPVVEKELLHFVILTAMHNAGHLRHLMFKGGTCLRLCHGAIRFSEDLDFSGGEAFDQALLEDIGEVVRDAIGDQDGLDVSVVLPDNNDDREMKRWTALVITRPAPTTATIGVQRIKIKIDNHKHPAGTILLPIMQHYDHLAGHYVSPLLRCAPLADICSDKLVAFPMSVVKRQNPRFRDVWDMLWMDQRTRDMDPILRAAAAKAKARGIGEEYERAQATMIDRIDGIVESDNFSGTLRRFLRAQTFDETVGNPEYREYMASRMKALIERIREGIPSGVMNRPLTR